MAGRNNPASANTGFPPGTGARINWNRNEIGIHIAAWLKERRRLAGSGGIHPEGREYPTIVDRISRLQLPRMQSSVFEVPMAYNKEIAEKVRRGAEKGHMVMGKFADILVAVDRQMLRQLQIIEEATDKFERRKGR